MDFLTLAKDRRSVRKYEDCPLKEEDINKILEAGLAAPTAANKYPIKIYVIKSPEACEKLKECTIYHFNTKTAFLVCYDRDAMWHHSRYYDINSGHVDVSIVTTHMMLEAHEIGVGTCWVMHFDYYKAAELYGLPKNIVPVALLPAGYPAPDAPISPNHYKRKTREEVVEEL